MSRVLVTGAAGFIGSHICDRLIEAGHHIFAIDDLSGGARENLSSATLSESQFAKLSVCDKEAIEELFASYKPDFVIHAAAMAAENLSHNCRVFTIQNNLVGEGVIRNACINNDVKCMVSLSSIAVMGHQEPPFDDDTPPAPKDVYGIMKYAGELDAKAAFEFHGLNYCVHRCHNVIGTRQNASDKYRNVAAIFIRQALEGNSMTMFGNGLQTRAFSPVNYVSRVIAETIDRPETWNQIFNVGSDTPTSVIDLAKIICRIAGVRETFNFLEPRKEAFNAHMTHLKCRKYFSHLPEPERLDITLSAMIAEARRKGFSPMQPGPDIEVKKGLPLHWS